MAPMMRSREVTALGNIVVSTHQYAPTLLIFRGEMMAMSLAQITFAISNAMPEALREGWRLLANSHVHAHNERAVLPTVRWIADHGTGLGFRTPNISERSKAFGILEYVDRLQLTDRQKFDAQGNAFDKSALLKRMFLP
eukprot:10757148-Heterocapsa_arctica.AAC.1